jgi:hypothetical protein
MAARRRPSLLSPFAMARRNAVYKGIFDGDRKWLVLGGIAWGGRFLKKQLGKNEELVTIERLEPGEGVVLRTIPTVKRRERKRAEKQAELRRKADAAAAKAAKRAARQAKKVARAA